MATPDSPEVGPQGPNYPPQLQYSFFFDYVHPNLGHVVQDHDLITNLRTQIHEEHAMEVEVTTEPRANRLPAARFSFRRFGAPHETIEDSRFSVYGPALTFIQGWLVAVKIPGAVLAGAQFRGFFGENDPRESIDILPELVRYFSDADEIANLSPIDFMGFPKPPA